MVYEPAEDSYFFAKFLRDYIKGKNIESCLDMGTGSGILTEAVSEVIDLKNILSVDIDKLSVDIVRNKGFKCIESNLFDKVNGSYDLIIFNAPYLPFDEREPKFSRIATTGGNRGDEISVKFLKQAKRYLNKNGKILLLISSLTPMNKIEKFGAKIVAKKKIFMEELKILEIQF